MTFDVVFNIDVFFCSTLVQTRNVFRQFGNVMETMTVEITQMRPRTARIGNVQQIISSRCYEKIRRKKCTGILKPA